MLKYRLETVALAALLACTCSVAQAGERLYRDHKNHFDRHHDRHIGKHDGRHQSKAQSIIGSNGLPSVIPGVGTFVGSISAVRIKGNGVFVAVDRSPAPSIVRYRAPKAKIIEISAENPEEACSFEAGVCVIRPTN